MTPGASPAGLVPGLLGTTAMTVTLAAEHRVRGHLDHPVDYDASSHVVTAASAVLRRTPATARGRRALFLLVHWGYGSAVGLAYPPLRRASGRDTVATAVLFAGCQTMAMTLFPTLGRTPPPWRWRADVLLSSLAQHAVYAVTVGTAARRLGPARRPVTARRRS